MQPLNKKALQKLADDVCKQAKQKYFQKHEVEGLLVIFYESLPENSPKRALDRSKFRQVLHRQFGMTEDLLMDRIFRAFDKDSDSFVNEKEWILGLGIFLRGSLDDQIKYAFEVYDLNSDGYISREEMFQMLKNSLVKQPTEEDPDEGIKDLVEITLKKMDHDHDSRLSLADFQKSVTNDKLLLEAYGCCLPDEKIKKEFEHKIREACNNM